MLIIVNLIIKDFSYINSNFTVNVRWKRNIFPYKPMDISKKRKVTI